VKKIDSRFRFNERRVLCGVALKDSYMNIHFSPLIKLAVQAGVTLPPLVVRRKNMSKRPRMKCNACGFSGNCTEFHFSLDHSHDVICPKCGSTKIDTSKMLEANPRYIYGSNNTIKNIGVTK